MVGDDDPDSPALELEEYILKLPNGQRIDPSEGLIEEKELGIEDQGAAYFQFSPFPPERL